MVITSKTENEKLIIMLDGRIDSANAADVEAKLTEIKDADPGLHIEIDAEKLEYISSAGLRVILRLRKADPELKIVNVSSEVYDIFEMTGFTEMITVEKAFRKMSVDGCEVIGRGAKGTVYRYNGDTIVKVYKNPDSLPDIMNERELARKAFVLGIPTAISYDVVKVGESYGSVFELLDAKSYSKLFLEEPDKLEENVKAFADLLRQIHETPVKKDDMPDAKIMANKWYDEVSKHITVEDSAKLRKMIDEVPDNMTMLHCDYHSNNVMRQNGETLLIDMDTLSHGNPVFELANVHITYVGFGYVRPQNVVDFLGIPYELALKIWDLFLPFYLQTDDPVIISEANKKIELLSCMRLLRACIKRKIVDEPKPESVQLCIDKIHSLLEEVDTLII